MKTNNILREKSYRFALRIIKLYLFLVKKNDYIISKQILRCGTSIGANFEEALGSQSHKEFFAKISIVYREARETQYWLRLLRDSHFISDSQANSLIYDCDEILKISGSIQKTMKEKLASTS
jgi:four helix bundle protein